MLNLTTCSRCGGAYGEDNPPVTDHGELICLDCLGRREAEFAEAQTRLEENDLKYDITVRCPEPL
jgi:hypothetical protein